MIPQPLKPLSTTTHPDPPSPCQCCSGSIALRIGAKLLPLCHNRGQCPPPDENSPYCQARAALPVERLEEIHDGLVADADAAIAAKDLWCGHRVTVIDGTTVTAPDTPANQKAYPQQSVQKPGCGYPILHIVAFLSLATGLLTAWAVGPWRQSEVALLQGLWDCLRAGDVLLGDRGFCNWGLLAAYWMHIRHSANRNHPDDF